MTDKQMEEKKKQSKQGGECEAVYGKSRCINAAKSLVVSEGRVFNLCSDCAKKARLQNKMNRKDL